MRINVITLLACFMAIVFTAQGQEGGPFTHIVTSEDSPRFFVMDTDGRGACYIAENATITKLLWQTKGWYSYPGTLYLTHNGTLIRRHVMDRTKDPIADKIILEFYHQGKLTKSYRVDELFASTAKLETFDINYTPHYILFGSNTSPGVYGRYDIQNMISDNAILVLPPRNGAIADQFFYIETALGEQIVFSIDDGKILHRGLKKSNQVRPDVKFPWEQPEESKKEAQQDAPSNR